MIKTQISNIINEIEAKRKKVARKTRGQQIVIICITCFLLFLLMMSDDLAVGLIFSFFVLIFALFCWLVVGSSSAIIGKMAVFLDLIRNIEHEIYPNSKVQYNLDTNFYNHKSNRTWEGRSLHGNYKAKYTDNWLNF